MNSSLPPSTVDEVAQHYRTLRDGHVVTRARIGRQRRFWSLGLLAVVAATLAAVERSRAGGVSVWVWTILFAVGALLLVRQAQLASAAERERRLVDVHDRNLARVTGAEPRTGHTGETLRTDDRLAPCLYERDLDLLGPDSLFGLLATVRTGIGQRGLASFLLEPCTHAESLARQAAVRELAPRTDLRERIALLGASKFQQVEARFFDRWLEDETPVFAPWFRPALAVTSVALMLLLLAGLLHVRAWDALFEPLTLAAAAQAALCLLLQMRVRPLLESTARLRNHVRMFAAGLALAEGEHFAAERLTRIQAAARVPTDALRQLSRLESQVALVEQRTKELFFVFSLLFAAGTQVAISLAGWKRKNAVAMRGWLDAWADFEALNALAGYAFEHPEDAWPELLPASRMPVFAAEALAHPLLPGGVANDIALGGSLANTRRFYLISGSNMSGKSTLMRSIGINAVLAFAGAPVRARSLRLSPFRIGASLALTDSLTGGKSKFLTEVERLQAIVALSATEPLLFLVDEIFSGTNSADRRTAAHAVLSRLLRNGAAGALSTHDLALTTLATPEAQGENVHMASSDPADPLAFDYRLKPGVNTESNAMAILRMMGLDDANAVARKSPTLPEMRRLV